MSGMFRPLSLKGLTNPPVWKVTTPVPTGAEVTYVAAPDATAVAIPPTWLALLQQSAPWDAVEASQSLLLGDTGPGVKLAQEWLTLAGYGLVVDSSYGPATQQAMARFSAANGLLGSWGPMAWGALLSPMTRTLRPLYLPKGSNLGSAVVGHAKTHLYSKAREVGGQNRGPWVRLYTGGQEGTNWPWCAAFATYLVHKVWTDAVGKKVAPVPRTASCDVLAMAADRSGKLLRSPLAKDRVKVLPGSIFLHKKTATDWDHCGIVTSTQTLASVTFDEVSGNSNNDGSRDGYEVVAGTRAFGNYDFILLS